TSSPLATTAPEVSPDCAGSRPAGWPAVVGEPVDEDASGLSSSATLVTSAGSGGVGVGAGVAAAAESAAGAALSFLGPPQAAAASSDNERIRDRAREFIAHPPGRRFS